MQETGFPGNPSTNARVPGEHDGFSGLQRHLPEFVFRSEGVERVFDEVVGIPPTHPPRGRHTSAVRDESMARMVSSRVSRAIPIIFGTAPASVASAAASSCWNSLPAAPRSD